MCGYLLLRREWDSNPRSGFPDSCFQDKPVRPLRHPSDGTDSSKYETARHLCNHLVLRGMLSLMRRMGIDYGTKRVGIAFTDERGMMAFPHATLPNDAALVAQVIALVREKEAGEVIVGRSHDFDGAPNAVQAHIDTFTAVLRNALDIPIREELEFMSTQHALRDQGRTANTDASAAALILDAYITRHHTTS